MPNVLIRDVPDDVHAKLRRRADEQGQSLQQYLAAEMRRLAERPSLTEVLERVARRSGGKVGFKEAVDDISAERARR